MSEVKNGISVRISCVRYRTTAGAVASLFGERPRTLPETKLARNAVRTEIEQRTRPYPRHTSCTTWEADRCSRQDFEGQLLSPQSFFWRKRLPNWIRCARHVLPTHLEFITPIPFWHFKDVNRMHSHIHLVHSFCCRSQKSSTQKIYPLPFG